MYILIWFENNKIKKCDCVSLLNAKNTKATIEKRGSLVCIFNKTFLHGIEEIKNMMVKSKDNFMLTMELLDKIENIEGGLL